MATFNLLDPTPEPEAMDCESDSITRWTVFITGFLQREGGATPLEKLHRRVERALTGPKSVVMLRSWRDNVEDIAQRIMNWTNGTRPNITVIGYSYGGWSANNLCRELQGFDLEVDHLLLVDPVGRWLGSFPSIFSMLDIIPLSVPENVRRVCVWRQSYNYPRGAFVRLEKEYSALEANIDPINCGTLWDRHLDDRKFPKTRHTQMDDLPGVRERVLQVCGMA